MLSYVFVSNAARVRVTIELGSLTICDPKYSQCLFHSIIVQYSTLIIYSRTIGQHRTGTIIRYNYCYCNTTNNYTNIVNPLYSRVVSCFTRAKWYSSIFLKVQSKNSINIPLKANERFQWKTLECKRCINQVVIRRKLYNFGNWTLNR